MTKPPMPRPPAHIQGPHAFVGARGASLIIARRDDGAAHLTVEDGGGRAVEIEIAHAEAIAIAVHLLRHAVGNALADAVAQRAADPLG